MTPLLVLLAAAVPADVFAVRTAVDVAALCSAMPLTELQARRYEAVVPASGLELAADEAPASRIMLWDGADLLAADGAANLYQMLDRRLPAEADAPAAHRVLAAKAAGILTLTVQFELPEEMTCSSRRGTSTRTVPIIPVAWTYRDGDRVLARGTRAPVSRVRGALRVEVDPPIRGPPGAQAVVAERTSELQACYARVLARYPDVQGSLTLALGGRRPLIAVDGAASAPLGNCVWRVLAGVTFAADALVRVRFSVE